MIGFFCIFVFMKTILGLILLPFIGGLFIFDRLIIAVIPWMQTTPFTKWTESSFLIWQSIARVITFIVARFLFSLL